MNPADQPAFPVSGDQSIDHNYRAQSGISGLTKLEWFASIALQGYCASAHAPPTKLAAIAFDVAQAMCDEAAKRKAGK